MRRVLGYLMIAGLMVGGVAGCGSDSSDGTGSDGGATTEAAGESSGGGNADVEAYCKAVDEYVAKAKDVGTDPAKAEALSTEAQELAEKATALASSGLDADDATRVGECTKASTEALMPG